MKRNDEEGQEKRRRRRREEGMICSSHTRREGTNWHKIEPKISQGVYKRDAEIEAKRGSKGWERNAFDRREGQRSRIKRSSKH